MRWRLASSAHRPRRHLGVEIRPLYGGSAAIASGELACDISVVISNHPNAQRQADFYGIPFRLIAIEPTSRAAAEHQMELLESYGAELVILARYMQILPPEFIRRYPHRIINIHHSFLPAFVGGKPYHQALDRGAKLLRYEMRTTSCSIIGPSSSVSVT
jgi:formyltetrahydrofolate deformylase